MKRTMVGLITALAGVLALASSGTCRAEEKLRFLLDWKAQAEHGGYYQALATGLYKKHGLDVTLMEGGPSVNNQQLIAAGAVELAQVSSDLAAFNLVRAGAPVRAVMASFQKDPQILMTHPRDDVKTLADMKGKPIMIADTAVNTYWVWLKATYGFSDSQIRKYSNNYGPFLADKSAIVQGYVTNSPLLAEREGVKPQIFLFSENGYPSYSAIVLAPQKLIDTKPDVIQAFVDATIEGWYSYLNGDPTPALMLIKKTNPDMSDEINAYVLKKLKDYELPNGDDAKTLGIGAMTDARWKAIFDEMVDAKIYPASMDYTKAFTLKFVNKRHGMAEGSQP
ncbi:MAG: putative transporter, periplasmic substrate-binding protein [Rhodospirillales bacterium]|nr:putative transporter, periplasmic substrate-binding protein [Rhodospirillales bacterium]